MIKQFYFIAGVNKLVKRWKAPHIKHPELDLVHGSNVATLNVVLDVANLLLQLVNGYLLVLDHANDLQFVDAVPDGDQLGRTPDETVHLDRLYLLEHFVHVSLIIPGLAVEEHGCLGNKGGLLGLLRMVCCKALLSDPLGIRGLLFLIVGSKQIDVVVIVGRGWRSFCKKKILN